MSAKTLNVDIAALTADLRKAMPANRSVQDELFAKLLPDIRDALQRKVTKKTLLAVLAKGGLKLSPARLKALLDQHEAQFSFVGEAGGEK